MAVVLFILGNSRATKRSKMSNSKDTNSAVSMNSNGKSPSGGVGIKFHGKVTS